MEIVGSNPIGVAIHAPTFPLRFPYFCIRAGDADAGPIREAALAHVRRTVRDKLLVSNPGWIGAGQRSECSR